MPEETVTPEQEAKRLEIRRRLASDFEFWCRTAYTIIDKNGDHQKLILNRAQRRVLDVILDFEERGKPIRIIILKGRQQGMSTMIEAWQLFKTTQKRGRRGFVLAHDAKSSGALFDQSKRGWENLPAILKPSKKRNNGKELIFGDLDSSLVVATAGGKGIGRGFTFQYVHASEVGFWDDGSAESNWNGLTQCVPPVADSAIFVESTANGMGGLFHRLWADAERGLSEFAAVFVPWFWQPEYRTEPAAAFSLSPEEVLLVRQFELDEAQLQWRRDKIAATSLDQFNQEYPNTPRDAFLTSGRPVFEPANIHKLMADAPQPTKRMGMFEGVFEEDQRGELNLFVERIDPTGNYYIGADVAEGLRHGDYSVAQVLDGQRRQVAVWRGHVYPDDFAYVLYEIGMMFNMAEVCVELNNHGILTANVLSKTLKYEAVWTDRQYDQIEDVETVRLGFTQNPKTRTMILNKLRADVRDWTIDIRDEETLKEMLHFVVNESGKMEAEAGSHDDHVLALALANHINEGDWTPIANSKDTYYEAI